MAPKPIRKVIKQFIEALERSEFPESEVYLFGSYARGDARPDSDIDICLVSPTFKTNKRKYELEATIIAFYTDPRIQVIITDPYKFKKDRLSPLFSRIRIEAVAA